MDLLDSVMELLSNTSSPSVTVNSTLSSDSIYQIPMEPNNLTQQAVGSEDDAQPSPGDAGVASGAVNGIGDSVAADRQPPDQDIPTLMPRLELKLPILSSSSSESETDELVGYATAGTSAEIPSERVASPPPNCAICLGRCKNKCFTDSCRHQFCFKCLCEWSKVKPECPLCKQTFKSIIHNVKSIDQFEEYHVQPPIVQIAHNQFDFPQMRMIVHQDVIRNEAFSERVRRQRLVFTSNNPMGSSSGSLLGNVGGGIGNRGGIRNLNDYNGEFLDMYRQEHPSSITSSDTLSQLWRRFVYDRKLYALPVCDVNGRFRDSSAQFYRENPAQIHRLAPWISRDIICLLRQTHHNVNTVIDSIHSSLTIMNILSPAFRRRLTPYLGNKTSHFIHELNNFARSPHDMFGYDGVVQYSPQSNEELVIGFTSSDDSTDNEIDVADDATLVMPAASTNAINLTIHNRLSSTSARGGETTGSTARQVIPDDANLVIDLRGETDEQSIAAVANTTGNGEEVNQTNPPVAENIELTSGSSDECEFVLERKPPHLRTPEMVSLDSASDSDVVFVDESKPLSKATFSTTEGEEDETITTARSKRPNTRSKITALVEAKKRSQQSTNSVKNESHGSSELYNVGASTSAALRLSIQRRGDESRPRRSNYCLRNNRSDPNLPPRRRGKRLGSESSHSSDSIVSTMSSITSSSSTSDEEFVASAAQKQNVSSRKRRRMRKAKNNKSSNPTKRSPPKRKKQNDDETSGEEDDNGHMGKNFALVMAIGERLKRQKAKLTRYRPAGASDDEEDSEGENTWRMEAVTEPLRKQQQENIRTKSALKPTERKRKVRRTTTQKANDEQACAAERNETAIAREDNANAFKNCDSSSDESDNLKLIELKSKLITKCCTDNPEFPTSSNRMQTDQQSKTVDSQCQNASDPCPDASMQTSTSPATVSRKNHTQFFKVEKEDMQSSTDNEQHEHEGPEDDEEFDEAGEDEFELHNGDERTREVSHGEHVDDFTEQVEDDHDRDQNINEYSNETTNLPSPMEQENIGDDHQDQHEDDDESQTPLNIHNPLNLSHETHAFDGTSMSTTTTTTDTILNDAAEQISSAAVNFYNPQPTFNTADFADDNTSNSSSSESSVSTTTTTSSSNSSSSTTNGFVNYDIS